MTDSTIHASDIKQAQARISSEIAPTPLQYCARLSAETGCEVYLKREDLQDVRSYKIRGALNGMSNVPQEERGRELLRPRPAIMRRAWLMPAAQWESPARFLCQSPRQCKSATASWFTAATK